jgi:ribonuclease HII
MNTVIGIDEVGRGCWAGPLLVVAARQKTELPTGVADSKVVSKPKREALFDAIGLSCDIGAGWVQPAEVDQLGLTEAMRLGVDRALSALEAAQDEPIIMDGNINYCAPEFTNVQCVVDADATHPIVSAASIYAKVLRDRYMAQAAIDYPGYGFEKHVGYGTKVHQLALATLGICELHRQSYKPVQVHL